MAIERSAVAKNDQWDVEDLFANMQEWEAAFAKSAAMGHKPLWPLLDQFKGRLNEGPQLLKEALDAQFQISRQLSLLYTYAHLRHDEDITQDDHKTAYQKIVTLCHDFAQESSWFEPELLALDEAFLSRLIQDQALLEYRFHLEKILRMKKHTLSLQGEELLAMSAKALQVSHRSFSALNDADFKFGVIQDGSGRDKELTHGSYSLYLRDPDRRLRENAFKTLQGKYLSYENTLSELINGQVQAHVFAARARNYSSCLEAALQPKNIDTEVYHALIKAVNDNIGQLHRYVGLREKIMGIGPLHLYDMYVPLIWAVDIRMSYQEAEEIVIESVAPLGTQYQDLLKKGFKDERWVDRYENQNKRSGAYSSGCYDSRPYILMNYKGILRDVFTLAHEAGHSMHSLMSHKHQPYHYGDYPIFLAEVASTFNEDLLMNLMLKRAKTQEERIFLINEKIEDIRGTLFRQTMFAEFELLIHELAEKNVPLTPKLLRSEYRKLNRRYFGEGVVIDEEAEAEWSRIPHFYYNFYVYQYATGISAALALSERVTHGGSVEQGEYLSFLKAGCSRYPIDILQTAGIDMRSSAPVVAAIGKFGRLVEQLEAELGSQKVVSQKDKKVLASS